MSGMTGTEAAQWAVGPVPEFNRCSAEDMCHNPWLLLIPIYPEAGLVNYMCLKVVIGRNHLSFSLN